MWQADDYKPEFNSLRDRLIEVAQIRNLGELLPRVVAMFTERPHVALCRLWLIDTGDLCKTCVQRSRCHNPSKCLHLAASSGTRLTGNGFDWSETDDKFQRIPLGVGKIGRVAATGQAAVVQDFRDVPGFMMRYQWAVRQGIRGLNVQPITFKDEILGAIALFTRIPTPPEGPAWMRIYADQVAGAIANARAFEEIERLRARLEQENSYLRAEVREAGAFGELIGQSPPMVELVRQLDMVARTDASVLILGESGTGKELVARELHNRSHRAERPLIRVNCASVPRDLYESEFFGHVKGAFTGAIKDRAGRFEAADGGTLLLDEVGEIPAGLQSKFLRVLQEKQYERVGEERTRTVDVRIIAATNRDLARDVEEGSFRQDLYYRLNVFPLVVPPLRDRREDIPLLARHFLEQSARRSRVATPRLTDGQVRLLQQQPWPGNVRELQNAVERALILSRSGVLRFDFEQNGLPATSDDFLVRLNNLPGEGNGYAQRQTELILTDAEIRLHERQNLLAALKKVKWKVHGPGGAAELLGVKPTTLMSRIKKLGLKSGECRR